jgi:hypothetical protein
MNGRSSSGFEIDKSPLAEHQARCARNSFMLWSFLFSLCASCFRVSQDLLPMLFAAGLLGLRAFYLV